LLLVLIVMLVLLLVLALPLVALPPEDVALPEVAVCGLLTLTLTLLVLLVLPLELEPLVKVTLYISGLTGVGVGGVVASMLMVLPVSAAESIRAACTVGVAIARPATSTRALILGNDKLAPDDPDLLGSTPEAT